MRIFKWIGFWTILSISILNGEIITIENDSELFSKKITWSVAGTIEFDIQKDENFIVAKIKRGVIRGGENHKNFTKRHVMDIKLCIGEDITKRWEIERCSEGYIIDRDLYNNELMGLEQHEFIIPIRSIGEEHNKKWFIVQISCGDKKNHGWCYMHNRRFKLSEIKESQKISYINQRFIKAIEEVK